MSSQKPKSSVQNRLYISLAIIAAALGLTFAPLPGVQQTIVVVSGSELEEPLQALKIKFERENPNIRMELKIQGSQELADKYLDDRNDFKPTVLIPANREILQELDTRWRTQNGGETFYESPQPIAKTLLVGIAWAERGKVLFPDGRFHWDKLETAMQKGNWKAIGGSADWGSFDFVTTDPLRSNSGQLTLSLWAQAKLGGNLTPAGLNNPAVQKLIQLAKTAIYQPPRSTDLLLQEFITRGPNDADVATVYESTALHRWQQSRAAQSQPYQIYYLNPTFETVSTAAIVRRDVSDGTAKAGKKFVAFLLQPEQQAVFVQYGFRPVVSSVDLKSVPNTPWNQNIPGVEITPTTQVIPPPNPQVLGEINRLWERAN
ncbi:MAG: substrate-binding domain-containing protein [Scytolyngbya sp. HA4215-MV1]|jgi:ABC-type molybdate transport system substrate-binding protein|nr:substrate-binding domain-containing protein [Scytolyngbya sp. HA4215-MV1]